MAMLSNNGLRCKARREPGREYCITCPQGLLEYARLQFLPSGELAVIANGFRMTDKPHSLSKFASAILRRFPRGEHGDYSSYGFRRLEVRSGRPYNR